MLLAERPHILVVDDDERIRSLLVRYLEREDYIISAAADAREARNVLQVSLYDLAVVDIMMPGEDGLSLSKFIKQTTDTMVILLTAKGEIPERIEGFEAGADDYVVKPFDPKELVMRIEAVLRRAGLTQKNASAVKSIRMGELEFTAGADHIDHAGQKIPLTQTESQLLAALSKKQGVPISREMLGQAVGLIGNDRAIDVQVTRLRKKIEPDASQPQYLQTIRGKGYCLKGDSV